jgi:hypothetical protein
MAVVLLQRPGGVPPASGACGRHGVDDTTEHVIAGTGYRVDLDRLDFLSDRLRARLHRVERAPSRSSTFESSAPGLYFIGLASAYSLGPMTRFVYGADYSARRLVGQLVAKSHELARRDGPVERSALVSSPRPAGARPGMRRAWRRLPGEGAAEAVGPVAPELGSGQRALEDRGGLQPGEPQHFLEPHPGDPWAAPPG